jgi:glycosyltransferase involved in cell wall biosynthesis
MSVQVSIIIPCYNASAFLAETLNSIFAQTYQEWEVVIVDDCSTDNSLEIAKQYEARYPDRIKVVQVPFDTNQGASYARNYGLQFTKGELINYIDADDLLIPDKIEKQVRVIQQYPSIGWVIANAHYFYEEPKNTNISYTSQYKNISPGVYPVPYLLEFFIKNFAITPCLMTALIRKEVIEQIGGWNDDFKMNFTDQVFYAKIVLNYDTYIMEEVVAWYRQHENSSTNLGLRSKNFLINQFKYWTWLENYVQGHREKITNEIAIFIREQKYKAYLQAYPLPKPSLKERLGRKIIRAIEIILNINNSKHHQRNKANLLYGIKSMSELWGFERGQPICLFYVNQFLEQYKSDIQGHCLEFQEDSYTSKYGSKQVSKLDILHIDNSNPKATIVADLTKPNDIPSNTFDCIICTHVLHVIYDLKKAISELHRILKKGGILLVAVPAVSMCDPQWHELWRFTEEGLRKTLESSFQKSTIITHAYGNALTAAGQIMGFAKEEYTEQELAYHDLRFSLEICARAVKQ